MTPPGTDRLPGDFWRYLAAVAASNLGDGIRFGALPLLAASITLDPIAVAGVTGITMLPWFVFGAVGGAIVDRVDRKRLIIVTQIARAVAVGALAAAIAAGSEGLALMYVVAFAIGLGEVLVDTASQAAIPQLAGSAGLEQANARMVARGWPPARSSGSRSAPRCPASQPWPRSPSTRSRSWWEHC